MEPMSTLSPCDTRRTQKQLPVVMLPALLAAAKPKGPAEAEGCGTGDGLAIHPARDVGRAAGVG